MGRAHRLRLLAGVHVLKVRGLSFSGCSVILRRFRLCKPLRIVQGLLWLQGIMRLWGLDILMFQEAFEAFKSLYVL